MTTRLNEHQLSQLAEAFQAGNLASFKELVEGLTRKLIATGYRYTRDWETARDLTQETWLKVYQRIGGYRAGEPFRNWLWTIHRNHCLSHLRRAYVRRERSADDQTIQQLGQGDESCDPARDLQREDFDRSLRRAMNELTESQRRVFAQVDLEQIAQKEAAENLGMNFTTLRTTLHAARRRLAGVLLKMEAES